MADASVTLDLDAREFDARLAAVEGKFNSTGGSITRTNEGIFTSSHRAARGIGNLATQLSSGADASQLMGTGLMSLERVLRVPLGSLAGLAIGAVFFEQIYKAQAEIKKADEELNKLLAQHPTAAISSVDELRTHVEQVAAAAEKANSARAGWFSSFMHSSREASAATGGSTAALDQEIAERKKREDRVSEEMQRSNAERVRSLARENLERETGGFGQERMKALDELTHATGKEGTTQGEALEHLRKYHDEIKEINQKEADGLTAAKESTMLQALEVNGQTKLAEALKVQLEYQKKINEAKREGEPGITAELEKQRQLAAGKSAGELYPDTTATTVGQYASLPPEQREFARRDDERKSVFDARDAERQEGLASHWTGLSSGVQSMPNPKAEEFKKALSNTEGILKMIQEQTKDLTPRNR